MKGYQLIGDLAAVGIDRAELRHLSRSGDLLRLRRGVYAPPAERDLEQHHRLIVESSLELGRAQSVVSFGSAAVLHGLPIWDGAIRKVHLTRARVSGGRIRRTVHVHVADLSPDDVTEIEGLPVTSLPRTVADYARTVPIPQAVAAGDRAVRKGLSLDQLSRQIELAKSRRGVGRLRHVAPLLDGRSESAGESISRVLFGQHDLPPADLQVEILSEGGSDRVDFLWREYGVIGEFDGLVKYGRLLRDGESPADAVVREKRREDRLRDLGYIVVRWIWADLDHPDILIPRIVRALERGRRWAAVS